ncbi:MAG: excalibur calcium-binding domain-containing protein [Nocardioides sp.]
MSLPPARWYRDQASEGHERYWDGQACSGDPGYGGHLDRDGDGVACEQ